MRLWHLSSRQSLFSRFCPSPPLCAILKNMTPVSLQSRTAAQKLLTAVFEVNEISEPPPPSDLLKGSECECKMVKKDAGDGTDLLIRWARGGPEDRIPSLLPRLKFCAWEVFNFLKSQLRSVGSVISPIAHRFSDCPYAWAWGGGSAFGDGGVGGAGEESIGWQLACYTVWQRWS